MRSILAELPGALLMATLTAIVTLALLLMLSLFLGGEARDLARQTRCYAALSNSILHELLDAHGIENGYPRVTPDGVDCSFLLHPPE
jgi:hypothetical protein